MSEKKKVKINGFVFTDEAEAEQAKKEAHGIPLIFLIIVICLLSF